jgi:hypothetical protein
MKKTLATVAFSGLLLLAGAGCAKESTLVNPGAMMKTETTDSMQNENKMEKDPTPAMKEGAMEKKDGDTMMNKNSDQMMNKAGAMMEKGSYETYSPEKLALAKDGKVVIFFKAGWCHTCNTVDLDVKEHLGEIPSGINILIADYDTSTDLKKKYGVTYQHTFVQVDAQGNLIKKWSGSPTLAMIVKEIK